MRISVRVLCLFVFVIFSTASIAASQVTNKIDVYGNVVTCEPYEIFLEGAKVATGLDECDARTAFLIENAEAGPSKFLKSYLQNTEAYSASYKLVDAMLRAVRSSTLRGENAAAYFLADEADRSIYNIFLQVGDEERATFYSSMLLSLKHNALSKELIKGLPIETFISSIQLSLEASLGPKYSFLDSYRRDLVLLCTIKTDNLRVPLPQVLLSKRLSQCLGCL